MKKILISLLTLKTLLFFASPSYPDAIAELLGRMDVSRLEYTVDKMIPKLEKELSGSLLNQVINNYYGKFNSGEDNKITCSAGLIKPGLGFQCELLIEVSSYLKYSDLNDYEKKRIKDIYESLYSIPNTQFSDALAVAMMRFFGNAGDAHRKTIYGNDALARRLGQMFTPYFDQRIKMDDEEIDRIGESLAQQIFIHTVISFEVEAPFEELELVEIVKPFWEQYRYKLNESYSSQVNGSYWKVAAPVDIPIFSVTQRQLLSISNP